MNAATQNTWTSYRDGRRVMHYMRSDGGRYFVQKVEAGYVVSFLADEGEGVSIRLSTEATLSAGKKWVADHLAAAPTLAECIAKFDDEPMYECEIPGAPGRITHGKPLEQSLQVVRQVALRPYQVEVAERLARFKRHRPKVYNTLHLGIDKFKIVRLGIASGIERYEQIETQDRRVCRIELELLEYEGKKRTPHRDRKVVRLLRILRILKRGLYE